MMSGTQSSDDANRLLDQVVESIRAQHVPELPSLAMEWPVAQSTSVAQSMSTERVSWIRNVVDGKFRLAASVLLMAMIGGSVFFAGWDASQKAFAQVQQKTRQAKMVSFRITTQHGEREASSVHVWVAPPDRVRAESVDQIHVLDLDVAKSLVIQKNSREALMQPVFDPDTMRKRVMGPFALLMDPLAGSDVQVVDKVVDGIAVQEFQMQWDGSEVVVWTDATTRLPVRMLVDRGPQPNGLVIQEVIDEFRFADDVDGSRFALDVPDDVALEVVQASAQEGNAGKHVISPATGLGPVQFGMTKKEVFGFLGKPNRVVSREGMVAIVDGDVPILTPEGKNVRFVPAEPKFTIDECMYDDLGFQIHVSSKEGVTKISCFAAGAVGPSSRAFAGQTPKGISIGSSWNEVIEAYGKPTSKLEGVSASYPGWHFNFVDRKLHVIHLRQIPKR